ncbi:MAG: 50S ribosome-binding GTPase [Bowdeniella nasicola]|nr:50S ribosome-binding GTPase [Bowdeniella nasicola]
MPRDCDERIERLREAFASPMSPWSEAEVEWAGAEIERIQRRRAIAAGHVVAALVGGTGSGKSSLFNALTSTTLADAGALRPTTEQATAFGWGEVPRSLIDYLGVPHERVTSRTTELDRADERPLDGLVLLDLPDLDSVKDAHSGLVDRLLPLVDVIVWVVDPQKYADHILHSRYLAAMRGRADAMVVVLNHVDRVPPARRSELVADIHGVLDLDGLPGVPVLTTSAITGEGIGEVHTLLAKANAEPSMTERTAAAELDQVVARLRDGLAEQEPAVDDALVVSTSDDLARACGLDAVVDGLRHAIANPRDASIPASQSPSYATVAAIGSAWTEAVNEGLPEVWAERIDDATPAVDELGTAAHEAASAVERPELVDGATRTARIAALIFVVLAGGLAIAAFTVLARPLGLALAGGCLLIALLAWLWARHHRARRAAREPEEYAEAVRSAVMAVVRARLVNPTLTILADHERLRALLS